MAAQVADPGSPGIQLAAWHPSVPGIAEVLHARFTDHAYPMHTHDAWTLLVVDDGIIRYDIDRREQGVVRPVVALLPPGVPHDGRAPPRTASASGSPTWTGRCCPTTSSGRRWTGPGSVTPSSVAR